MKTKEIQECKNAFNHFFKDELYGKYKDKNNIILSRGAWNDDVLLMPDVFKFCINYAFEKKWTGYSDSLRHERPLRASLKYFKSQNLDYTGDQIGLSLGNVTSINPIFNCLRDNYDIKRVICFCPYYPPILKSVSRLFADVELVSSMQSEEDILKDIERIIKLGDLLFLTNSIGVDGRIYSKDFWSKILKICESKSLYLVIDEGIWFEKLDYPKEICKSKVIRLISTSKKYGIPGCKIGLIVADEEFMSKYYDYASTYYGGPLSSYFMLIEFLLLFEALSEKNDLGVLKELSKYYEIDNVKIKQLFYNFKKTQEINYQKLLNNSRILMSWANNHKDVITLEYYGGLNCLVKLKKPIKSEELFRQLIKKTRTSIFPGKCIGLIEDNIFRITLLESSEDLKMGLSNISKIICNYKGD